MRPRVDPAAGRATSGKEVLVLKWVILLGLLGGAFFAWKKFMAAGEDEDDLAEEMYGAEAPLTTEASATPS